ncbi:thiamine pyrophosphate-binding protein [Pseudomonas sp. NPDC090202]|uniref:thiamine pyrophosphate-binding protein n=1 Tax=unclassified Pseudomonas TaxID=196821 RepID=UPI0038264BFA
MNQSVSNPVLAPSKLSRWWHRWRFHLNILLLLIPLGFIPRYFADVALFRGDSGLGEREIGEIQIGPWSLKLAEFRDQAPLLEGPAGYMKVFTGALCERCIHEVKATYLRVGKPRSLRAAGALFEGTPHRMAADVPIPKRATGDGELWITLEGWDGSVHQAAVPLTQASPATVTWLDKQGAKR